MSADYGTSLFKAYLHNGRDGHGPYLHIVIKGDPEWAWGDVSLAEIGELVQLAGQAWPGEEQVEVRYVIEAQHRPPAPWVAMWSARADSSVEQDGLAGVSEEFAVEALAGFASSKLRTRLVRRTIVIHDEPINPGDGEAPG